MKLNVSKEYIRRIRKVLKSTLNGGNLVRGANTWAVNTRKLFTIYGALHPKSDVERLYVTRKEGGRDLISIKDCVEFMEERKD